MKNDNGSTTVYSVCNYYIIGTHGECNSVG